MMLRLASRGFLTVALLIATLDAALAQSGATTGLMGRVTDPTGAGAPGVAITVTNVDTGIVRTVRTSSTGDWEARFLTPGTYRVTFELSGFKQVRRDGITVSTAEMSTVDVTLDVGGLAEAVQVTANAEMVSSGSMTVQRTLDQKELDSLPTSARNFTQLLVIEPGVSADISELLSNDNASISPSVNGARTTNNSFVFNGVDVTNLLCCNSRVNGSSGTIDNGGGSLSRNVAPAPETLQEVKLQTSLYDAGTGRNGGGNFTLVSKSGTNNFRGSGYYYNQNDALMANDFFFNRAGIEKPILDRHEGGGTIGGPLVQNRTFFFGSYQRTQAETSFVDEASNTVLMPRALTDDRSDAGINNFAAAIWNPNHGPVNFSVINPISRALLKAKFPDGTYLIPSGAGGVNCGRSGSQLYESCQVVSVVPATFEQDQFTTNLDHQVTNANRVSGKFFFSNQPSRDPLANGNALTRFERQDTTYQRTFSLTDLHIFSPSVLNEFRAGFFRNRNDSDPVPYFTNAEFGIVNPLDSKVPDLTQLDIRGDRDVGGRVRFGTPSDGTRIYDLQTTYTIGNTLTLTKGKHSIRAGGEFRRHHLDGDLREGQNRRHNFRSWFDFLTVGYRNPSDVLRAHDRQFRQFAAPGASVLPRAAAEQPRRLQRGPHRFPCAPHSIDERGLRRWRSDPRRLQRPEQRVRGARDPDGVTRPPDAAPSAVELQHAVGIQAQLAARGGLHRHQGQRPAAVHQPEPGARHRCARWFSTARRRARRRVHRQLLHRGQQSVRQYEDASPRMRSLR
jgi:hypothetical protein